MNFNQKVFNQLNRELYTLKFGGIIVTLTTRTTLIAIILLAVVLRLISAIYQGNDVTNLPGIYDQISYNGLAQRVVDGYGFTFAEDHWPATPAGEPTAHWSFLYTLYLGAIYKIFGYYPIIARVIQALIVGVFHIWFVFRIGKRIFGKTVGLVSAFLSAVYIYFFYYSGGLVTETFFITAILWTFDCTLRLYDGYKLQLKHEEKNKRWIHWIELALALGVTILLRQTFLLFLPILFVWLWWNIPGYSTISLFRNFKIRFASWSVVSGLIASIFVIGLMIIPWTIRNYRAFNTFVLLNTNAGFAFFWGNHPIHGTKFIPILSKTGPSYQELIPPEYLGTNEGKLDRMLLQDGVQFVIDDPMRYVILSISRLEEFFKFWPSSDSDLISNISRVGSFGILFPFMLVGLFRTVSKMRDPIQRQNWELVTLILLFVCYYSILHLLSWTLIRYRLPVDSILVIFAALGIIHIYNRVNNFRKKENNSLAGKV